MLGKLGEVVFLLCFQVTTSEIQCKRNQSEITFRSQVKVCLSCYMLLAALYCYLAQFGAPDYGKIHFLLE